MDANTHAAGDARADDEHDHAGEHRAGANFPGALRRPEQMEPNILIRGRRHSNPGGYILGSNPARPQDVQQQYGDPSLDSKLAPVLDKINPANR